MTAVVDPDFNVVISPNESTDKFVKAEPSPAKADADTLP